MPLKEQLPRYVLASTYKHFKAIAGNSLKMFIEGQPRKTNDQSSWLELRVDGPFINEFSRENFVVTIEVNLLVSSQLHKTDLYLHQKNVATGLKCFTKRIEVVTEIGQHYFCFTKIDERRDKLVVSNFGQIDPHINLQQSTIEAHYRANVKGNTTLFESIGSDLEMSQEII